MAERIAWVSTSQPDASAGPGTAVLGGMHALLQELFFLLRDDVNAAARVTVLPAFMPARKFVPAEVLAIHREGAERLLDCLLAASAFLVHNLLARLTVTVVAVVEARMATRQDLAALVVAFGDLSTALDGSRNHPTAARATKGLVDHDLAITTLAGVALPGARMDSALQHSATVLET